MSCYIKITEICGDFRNGWMVLPVAFNSINLFVFTSINYELISRPIYVYIKHSRSRSYFRLILTINRGFRKLIGVPALVEIILRPFLV